MMMATDSLKGSLAMTKRSLLATSSLVLSLIALPVMAQEGGYNPSTNIEMRLSAVEDQIRSLTGKVEQVDFLSRRMEQTLARMQADYDARLTKLEMSAVQQSAAAAPQTQHQQAPVIVPSPTAGAPAQEEQAEESAAEQPAVVGSLGGVKVRGDKITGAIVSPKAPPLPNKPDDYGLTAQESYDRAFGLLRQANYEDAERAFKGFIDKHGQDKLIDNAKYWYAETFYVRAKFGDAAVAFAEAFQQNPKGTKAPDALLKLALSLASMDKPNDACDTLSALKAKYPNAAATIRSRADQERTRLKCK